MESEWITLEFLDDSLHAKSEIWEPPVIFGSNIISSSLLVRLWSLVRVVNVDQISYLNWGRKHSRQVTLSPLLPVLTDWSRLSVCLWRA